MDAAGSGEGSPLLPRDVRVLWHGKGLNSALLFSLPGPVLTLCPAMDHIPNLSKIRYWSKFPRVRCVDAPRGHGCHVDFSAGSTTRDAFIATVGRREWHDVLAQAIQIPSVVCVALMLVGDGPQLELPGHDGWTGISREVLWASCTQFDTASNFVLFLRKADCKEKLNEQFQGALQAVRVLGAAPKIEYPFNEYAGMAPSSATVEQVCRDGEEEVIYRILSKGKRQKATAQIPLPRSGIAILATGPWAGLRELQSPDFLHLLGYTPGAVSLHLLNPAVQMQVLGSSVPCKLAELMLRCVAQAMSL